MLNGFLRGGSFASTELVELMAKWINLENPTPIKVEYGTSPGIFSILQFELTGCSTLSMIYKQPL